MDFAQFLTEILIVLVAAKAAAEVSERIGIPAVVGEILAGVIVGPSVLGMVDGHDEVLVTLGELGVILLLLEVGMEMDLAELAKVGRASFQVAVVGVVMPMALGFAAMYVPEKHGGAGLSRLDAVLSGGFSLLLDEFLLEDFTLLSFSLLVNSPL